jgi:hypothetical protein
MRIYITHCCAKKNDSLKYTGTEVFPEQLYIATPTKRFIRRCKDKQVKWAIFSDLYGVWFPDVRHQWYEKNPDKVTEEEFNHLLWDFEEKLTGYEEIWFYHNPGRFHKLYKRLVVTTKLTNIHMFSHIDEVE